MSPVPSSALRRSLRRFTAACLALAVFAASGGASLIGQVCMHHGGDVAQASHAAVPSTEGPHAHHGHVAAMDQDPAESHDAGECTCLSACHSVTAAPAPADAPVVRIAEPVETARAPIYPSDLLPRSSQATWFLPPGNGPPALT